MDTFAVLDADAAENGANFASASFAQRIDARALQWAHLRKQLRGLLVAIPRDAFVFEFKDGSTVRLR